MRTRGVSISGRVEGRDGTYEVEDVLALASETDCLIGHEASSLCCAHYMGSDSEQYARSRAGTDSFHVPLPQRLVFPLLQNLHSRHSSYNQVSMHASPSNCSNSNWDRGESPRHDVPAVYSGITWSPYLNARSANPILQLYNDAS